MPIRQLQWKGTRNKWCNAPQTDLWRISTQDVVRAVDIRVNCLPCSGKKEPSFDPLTQILIMALNGFQIKKAALGGVTFLDSDHLDAYKCSFVGQHLDETRMGNEDKRLIIPLPYAHLLFSSPHSYQSPAYQCLLVPASQ
jgi:hypothetical protein